MLNLMQMGLQLISNEKQQTEQFKRLMRWEFDALFSFV